MTAARLVSSFAADPGLETVVPPRFFHGEKLSEEYNGPRCFVEYVRIVWELDEDARAGPNDDPDDSVEASAVADLHEM
eukprot:jgi/Tetstr1/433174/TSEL_002359.t1